MLLFVSLLTAIMLAMAQAVSLVIWDLRLGREDWGPAEGDGTRKRSMHTSREGTESLLHFESHPNHAQCKQYGFPHEALMGNGPGCRVEARLRPWMGFATRAGHELTRAPHSGRGEI